jgi:hypothetical protein
MVVDGLIEPLLSRLNCHRYLLFAFLSKTNSDVDGEIIPPQAVPIAPVVATGNDAEACSREKRHARRPGEKMSTEPWRHIGA